MLGNAVVQPVDSLLGPLGASYMLRASEQLSPGKAYALAVVFEPERAVQILQFFARRGTPLSLNDQIRAQQQCESDALWFSVMLPYRECVQALVDAAVDVVLEVWRVTCGSCEDLAASAAAAADAAHSLQQWHAAARGTPTTNARARAAVLLTHLAAPVRQTLVLDTLMTVANLMHVRGPLSNDPTPAFPLFTWREASVVPASAVQRELCLRGLGNSSFSLQDQRATLLRDMLTDPFFGCKIAWDKIHRLRAGLLGVQGGGGMHRVFCTFLDACRARCSPENCARPLHGKKPSVAALVAPASHFLREVRRESVCITSAAGERSPRAEPSAAKRTSTSPSAVVPGPSRGNPHHTRS